MAAALLSHRQADGTIATHPYKKWQGPHLRLYSLAQLGHPSGDESLRPLFEQGCGWLLARQHLRPPSTAILPGQAGRIRRCAPQEGVAIWYAVTLGLADDRTDELVSQLVSRLVSRLVTRQWPDGGWNCDLDASAASSSVYETLLPMRGLAAYGSAAGDEAATHAARRAADVLLDRRVVFHRSSGELIDPNWARLHYPLYWRYDVLGGLKGLAELGLVTDDRCEAALDLLEAKELPDGAGWAAEARYYQGRAGSRPGTTTW